MLGNLKAPRSLRFQEALPHENLRIARRPTETAVMHKILSKHATSHCNQWISNKHKMWKSCKVWPSRHCWTRRITKMWLQSISTSWNLLHVASVLFWKFCAFISIHCMH